jgi:zinc protease
MTGALIVIALVACGPKQRVLSQDAPVPWEASGVDWTQPPPLAAPLPFAPPSIEELRLSNGARMIVVTNRRLPVLAISAVVDGAGSREDRGMPGLAALTADMLDDGTRSSDGAALLRDLELAGTHHAIRISSDSASVQLVTSSDLSRYPITLLADMLRNPRFDEADLERIRKLRLAELEQRRQRARTTAAQVFDRVTFGAHPYASPAEGHKASVAKLTAADVRAFWRRTYAPSSLTLIMAGDIDRERARSLAESSFGAWKHATTPSPAPPLGAFAPQLAFVDAPGAAQSVVLIGRRAPAAGEQQIAADVANAIVGGGIGARLDRKLHEELALTLGASASFWRGRWAGSWAAATTFATDNTIAGIRAALEVIEQARSTIGAAELARAKSDLLAAAQQSFETSAGTARALERIVAQGLPSDWYTTYATRLAALTVADVQAAANWQDLAVVIVGDWVKLGPQVGELGMPIVQYDRDGIRQP